MVQLNQISRGGRAAGRNPGQSVRNVNLTRLCQATSPELIAVALVLREESVKSFLRGELIRGETAQQISEHLADAGFPAGWLDTPELPITPEMVTGLMELVSMSKEKAPLRRANLLKLHDAFNGRTSLLADAIEILEASLLTILDGSSRFDDTRMWHVNPLLMQAGFPNGWLEMPNAPLEPEWIAALETRATDAAELAFEEESIAQQAAPAPVAPPATVPATAASTPAAPAESTPSKQEAAVPTKPTKATPAAKPVAKIPRGALKAARPLTSPAADTSAKSEKPEAALPPHKQHSVNRANALSQLLDGARRGAKVYLWREIMGKGLPYAANIRSGDIIFNDDMAREVCQALELPAGWLDNPEFPPKTLAAWVMDNSVPFPPVEEVKARLVAEPVAQKSRVGAVEDPTIHGLFGRTVPVLHKGGLRSSQAAQAATTATPATETPKDSREPKVIRRTPTTPVAEKPAEAAAPTAVTPPAKKPATAKVAASAPPPAAQEPKVIPSFLAKPAPASEAPVVTVPAPEPAAQPAARVAATLVWTPVADAPRTTPGPAAAALAATLMQFSCDGKLSEAAAAQMLAALLTTE